MTWEIRIDRWHPARLNELLGSHWAVAAKRKKADAQMIAVYGRHVPKATGKRRVELEIILKPKQRGGDVDAYAKSLLDGLVRAELLVDDNRQHVELSQPTYRLSHNPSVVVRCCHI